LPAEAMQDVRGARDIFVTENGTRDEPIIGMVTNIDLEKTL
jgi:hypothetical protein